MGDVTAVMMDVITEKSGHQVVPMAVSVCTTPAAPAPLPIPYPVIGNSSEGIVDPPMRTKINGAPIATVGSCIKSCHGNEPGTLKEVVSLNTTGPCLVVMGAPIVLIELGMAGITGSPCISNKAITVGAPANASGAGGTGGAGSGAGGSGGGAGDASGSQGPSGGGGGGGGGSNAGASGPGSSSGAAGEHQCQNGHPVDVVSGCVVDTATDLNLPGLIAFAWTRTYSSSRRTDKDATMGPGWAHGLEQRITAEDEVITLRDAEGRSIWFSKVLPGESTFHRRERMTLHRDGEDAYRVEVTDRRLTYVFRAQKAGGPALLCAVKDASDNAITMEHDGARLARILDTAGREIRVKWKEGRIVRLEVHVDQRLEQWCDYTYSSSGCLIAAADALGNADEYEYDRHHRMVAATIKTGARFQYEYEADTGRCQKSWGPKGLYAIELELDRANKTTYVHGEEPRVITWNDQGVATRLALPDGTVLEESAFDDDGYLIARVNGAGEGEQHWYDTRGNRVRTVDAAGNATAWEYEGDLLKRQITPDGLITEVSHDAKGKVVAVRYPSGAAKTFSYDERGRLTAMHEQGVQVRALEYDSRHDVVAETDASGARTTYAYDALGRPTRRTDALGRSSRLSYDRLGRPIALRLPDGASVQRVFDANGKLVRELDPAGRATTIERSGMGAISRLTHADGATWSFAYTSFERLAQVKNPRGESYVFVRDDAGRVIEERTFDGRVMRYRRGASARLEEITHGDGSHRRLAYDRLGRVVRDEASDGSVLSFQRDKLGRVAVAALEEAGHRFETWFERDALGRVVAERQGDRTLRYGYDALGRRTERTLPDGTRTRYAYDARGMATKVDHGGHVMDIERDAVGREIRRGDAEGRLSIHSRYDELDRLVEQRAVVPAGDVLAQRQWQFDRTGRVTRIDDARWGTTQYRYDRMDHLIEAVRGPHREAFAYDPAGSLISALQGLDGREEPWKVAPGNLLLQTKQAKYTYDARGRRAVKLDLTAKIDGEARATSYAWDARDQLREVRLPDGGRVVMRHDALGRRVRKEVYAPGAESPRRVDFVWDGDVIAAEIDTEHGMRSFVHRPGTVIPLLQSERGNVFTVVTDHLGAPRELIDRAGVLAWSVCTSVWGRVTETHAGGLTAPDGKRPVRSPFRLLGQYEDEETGLCMTRYRAFDPEVGRWLSPDPLGGVASWELFGFDGCPTLDVDPFGLSTGPPHDVKQAIEDLPDEERERLLMRVKRTDKKGRAFGTPRHPDPPSVDEFNPRIKNVRAGDLQDGITDRKHGIFPDQEAQIRKLSNDELLKFRMEDPISATEGSNGMSLTGGHHRTAEIARRVQTGELPADTPVPFLMHD